MILYFTALEREVTKAVTSCKKNYFLLFLSLKLALLNLFGPNLGYLWITKRSMNSSLDKIKDFKHLSIPRVLKTLKIN